MLLLFKLSNELFIPIIHTHMNRMIDILIEKPYMIPYFYKKIKESNLTECEYFTPNSLIFITLFCVTIKNSNNKKL